jgi:hypothetical protein
MELAEAEPEWTVGFGDECWWSRVALPTLNAWADADKPPRLIQRSVAKDDPSEATKAISCYGVHLSSLDQTWIRFVDGRPVLPKRHGSFLGVLRDSKLWARRSSCSSGTTLPGTSPRR